jgi:hypothetical protein
MPPAGARIYFAHHSDRCSSPLARRGPQCCGGLFVDQRNANYMPLSVRSARARSNVSAGFSAITSSARRRSRWLRLASTLRSSGSSAFATAARPCSSHRNRSRATQEHVKLRGQSSTSRDFAVAIHEAAYKLAGEALGIELEPTTLRRGLRRL